MNNRTYVCIDLKSFYASVECVARGLDPFTTNLVVADPDRTEKTICLAVSPAMKALGVPGRCRVFEIPKSIKYIMATPRMQTYIDVSADIYGIYLSYFSKDDIHVYSIDEVFIDVTTYLDLYRLSARELSLKIMGDVLAKTGICATAGIGTNLYLAKIALDIMAKHAPDHIGELDEENYCRKLWEHRPITDFWRIGPGTARRLLHNGMETMGDIARADESLLYHLFGVDGELIIDHAWGRESATMADIKAYKPKSNCLSSGQVLPRDYGHAEGRLVAREMADIMCLNLVAKGKITQLITMYIGYPKAAMTSSDNGSIKLPYATSSARVIIPYVEQLYDNIKDPSIPLKHIAIAFCNIEDAEFVQYDLFSNPEDMERDNKVQHAMLEIKDRFGLNAVVKGMNLQEGATTMARNNQIGGHRR